MHISEEESEDLPVQGSSGACQLKELALKRGIPSML